MANQHVPAILAGTESPVTSDNGYINMGGPHEATDYVAGCGPALHGTPGAVEWLTNQNSCCPAAKTTVSCPLIPVSRAMTPSIERRCLVGHAPWSGWSVGARERGVQAFGRAADRSAVPSFDSLAVRRLMRRR
jgi:hypothetical protein